MVNHSEGRDHHTERVIFFYYMCNPKFSESINQQWQPKGMEQYIMMVF